VGRYRASAGNMSCFRCCRARGDARRDVGAGRHGPRATEGLVSEEEIVGDYDAALTKLWGGPPPRHFPAALATWPARFASGRGRAALVTGGAAGIGFYVAKMLCALGYVVIVPGRAAPLDREAVGAKRAIEAAVGGAVGGGGGGSGGGGGGGEILIPSEPLDLGSFASVRAFAASVRAALAARAEPLPLSLLCLNAGRGGSAKDPRELTRDGHEAIMQVNALSHFLLAAELLPLLRAAPGGARIVSQSSGARKMWTGSGAEAHARLAADLNGDRSAADGTYNAFQQYCLSKAANCLFTIGLNARLRGERVVAVATDPGFSSTGVNIQHNLGHSLLKVPDGLLATSTMHDLAGHHAADGALMMALACVDPAAAPNDFFSPASGKVGAPRRDTPATLAAAENAARDPMSGAAWQDRAATAEAFFRAAGAATGVAESAWVA